MKPISKPLQNKNTIFFKIEKYFFNNVLIHKISVDSFLYLS
ncbi:hypothetical protein PT2222_130016 [Paraburkholderia tropica]